MNEPAIDFRDLLEALEWVSSGQSSGLDATAFVDHESAAVIWVGTDEDEELPGDLDENDRYVSVAVAYRSRAGSPDGHRFHTPADSR
jgi:hypothetical protein